MESRWDVYANIADVVYHLLLWYNSNFICWLFSRSTCKMLKTRPDISKKSKSRNLDPSSRETEIRAQQVETEKANTKPLQQHKGRLLSSRAHTPTTRFVDPLPFWPPAPLPHHPQLLHILPSCQTFALCAQSNSLFLQKHTWKSTRGGSRGRGGGHMVRVELWKRHVYLAGGMLLVLPIANHNIRNVSAITGDYTLKTALFAWRQTNGLWQKFREAKVQE